jgi:cell division control protein 6
VAALASRDHGDARQAVALLSKSAYLAEKAGTKISLEIVDHACSEIEQDKYVTMIRTAPRQLQAAMGAVIQCVGDGGREKGETSEVYHSYSTCCHKVGLRPLTRRAFGDLLNELDMYSLLQSHVVSRGRYGRAREITMDLPEDLTGRIYEEIKRSLEM